DHWRPNDRGDNSLFTSAFTDVIFNQNNEKSTPQVAAAANLSFRLRIARVTDNQTVAIVGSCKELKNWQLEKALPLQYLGDSNWGIDLTLKSTGKIEYKFGILDKKTGELLFLEREDNRILKIEELPKSGEKRIVQAENFAHPAGDWRGTGLAIPVFSIRTKNSLGIGEFTDINAFTDWTERLGMDLVQILPVNDTNSLNGWIDSYPYKAISVFGLHPMYLNLDSIEGFKKAVDQKEFRAQRDRLNAVPVVDYEAVLGLKMQWARQIFEQQKTRFLKKKAVKTFIEENAHWLKPYAAFCYLRDKYQTPEFEQWKTYSKFSPASLAKLTDQKAKHFDEIAFNYFLQYYLDKQLVDAREYARSKSIVLKGDIPIGIHRHSADAWVSPELYNMDGQAGAPPDPFSDDGQNWGFPTYKWEVMAQDGYQWWKNRFTQLSRYFDAFRIDHILGFFRIWQIPLHAVVGTLGYFNKAIPIHRNEFAERGIWFDYDRMCRPYVRENLLQQIFGSEADAVRETFFNSTDWQVYQFKTEFDTQRKIEAWMKNHPQHKHLEKGLFDLHGNVLFIEHEGSNGEYFHPRIEMQKISSYYELDEANQHKVNALYQNYFYERQDEFWLEQAMEKLPAIKEATNMLICGEDLGMVPEVVPGVMEELEILTLEIQRMSKTPKTEFVQTADLPYLSVARPSTHDMEHLRLWWEDMDREKKHRFLQNELGIVG
ncbi:MAG: 4-alpha-glucanotransferase, partial [Saprospiraceae bacterium]